MKHTELDIWKVAIELTTEIYIVTATFPKDERFGLVSQIRRASVSVPSNIAEGAGRKSHPQFRNFLLIASGSLAELETQLFIARNIGYLDADTLTGLIDKLKRVSAMLRKMSESLT